MTFRSSRGEDGTSLILALAFMMVFALLIPAILDLGNTNVLATVRLQSQRSDTYLADGAVDGAIQYIKLHDECARPAPIPACPNFVWSDGGRTATVSYHNISNDLLVQDREVTLTASVDGVNRLNADVVIKDSNQSTTPVDRPVEVKSWTYIR